MTVKELMKKLAKLDPEAKVWIQDAGASHKGSDLTGTMWHDDEEAEDVREINTGVLITKY